LVSLVCVGMAGTTAEWKERIIYQFLTDRFANSQGSTSQCNNLSDYCGGSYQGAIDQLDYIQGMGFTAVWISPIVLNTPNGYHGYWAQNWYEVNPNFGSSADLQNFIDECHKRDIWVMVDVVANHVGPVGYDYSTIVPFNDSSHYHNCNSCPDQCTIQNYVCFTDDIELCRTSGLPDLNQTVPFVGNFLTQWVGDLVEEFDVDGLRIDTIPEVDPNFWKSYQQSAGVYAVGEVFTSDVSCIGTYSQVIDGVLSYPMFFTLRNIFQQSYSMNTINSTLNQYNQYLTDPTAVGSFIDNHDNARFLCNNNDIIAYKSAITYVLMGQGIPIIYYGTEQEFSGCSDPYNREVLWPTNYNTNAALYQFIKTINDFRNSVNLGQYVQVQSYSNDNQFYAFFRGLAWVGLTNQKNDIERNICFHPYSEGQLICNIFYPTDCVQVENGCFPCYLNDGESKIFYPSS